jgi:ribosomal protein S18 acetylase RimI-like enzyme
MRGLELEPFADDHVEAAAAVLAARHARHREAEPLLPAAFEEPGEARSAVEEAWGADGASGAVAIRDGRLVGYLVAAPRTQPVWGPNVWVETGGHAVEEPETLRDLYAFAAGGWVDAGATRQYAIVPATDAAVVDAWFRLGFGQQHALGIREVPEPPDAPPAPVQVRRATVDDVDALLPLDLLGAHQAASPIFAAVPAQDPAEQRAEIAEEVADPDSAILVADLDGRLVACASVAPISYSSLHAGPARPEQACVLGYAATLPEARGSGAGTALTEGVFAWAREQGFGTVVVDWRVANLEASRFWPARGFRTTFLRLYRSIP